MRHSLPAITAGLLFGFGLAYSGMTDTSKVIGFLDVFGAWDYDLAFVMGGALLVSLVSFQLMKNRKTSLFNCPIDLPRNKLLDIHLIGGSALFGIGWGLFGYCPGPALTALIYLDSLTILFVVSMILGMTAHRFLKFGSPP